MTRKLVKELAVLTPLKGTQLYTFGEPSDSTTLILQGKLRLQIGQEAIETVVGPWTVLGMKVRRKSKEARVTDSFNTVRWVSAIHRSVKSPDFVGL